ncbi:hypothetical protein ABZP36_002651 [Zizania latifolia]
MYGAPDCVRYCHECRRTTSMVLDHATGDAVCTECTLLLGEHFVDKSSKRRRASSSNDGGAGADSDSDSSRGKDPSLHGQLADDVACSSDPQKVQANAGSVPRMRGAVPAQNKALAEGFKGIADMADKLGLAPGVSDRGKEVFRKLEEAKLWPKARNRDALYAACLHAACRSEGSPRTVKELTSATTDAMATRRDIGKYIHLIKKRLENEEHGGGQAADRGGAVVRAGDYLRRYGPALGTGNNELGAAMDAAGRLDESLDVRRNPQSIAAALIYMAMQRSGCSKTVRDVSAATGVSESTIKDACRDLSAHSELLFR